MRHDAHLPSHSKKRSPGIPRNRLNDAISDARWALDNGDPHQRDAAFKGLYQAVTGDPSRRDQ